MIKAVVFDCFGVMILPGRTLLYQAFPELATGISALERNSDAGNMTRRQFVESISELTGVDKQVVDDKYYDVTGYHEAIIKWATELHQSGKYKIGLLSNIGHDWLNDFLADPSVSGLFDTVVLSCDVAMLKPDPKIFKLMAGKMGVPINECVMIDDIPANVDGAIAAGMKSIMFASTIQTIDDFNEMVSAESA